MVHDDGYRRFGRGSEEFLVHLLSLSHFLILSSAYGILDAPDATANPGDPFHPPL